MKIFNRRLRLSSSNGKSNFTLKPSDPGAIKVKIAFIIRSYQLAKRLSSVYVCNFSDLFMCIKAIVFQFYIFYFLLVRIRQTSFASRIFRYGFFGILPYFSCSFMLLQLVLNYILDVYLQVVSVSVLYLIRSSLMLLLISFSFTSYLFQFYSHFSHYRIMIESAKSVFSLLVFKPSFPYLSLRSLIIIVKSCLLRQCTSLSIS